MKTTLIVIENEADHAQAKSLVEKLMGSTKPDDRADGGADTLDRGL